MPLHPANLKVHELPSWESVLAEVPLEYRSTIKKWPQLTCPFCDRDLREDLDFLDLWDFFIAEMTYLHECYICHALLEIRIESINVEVEGEGPEHIPRDPLDYPEND